MELKLIIFMKIFLKHFIVSFLAIVGGYLMIAFLNFEFNPGLWADGARAGYLAGVIALIIVSNIMIHDENF